MEQNNQSNFWCQTEDTVNSCPRGQILMATHEGYEILQPVFSQVNSMPPSILPTWTWTYRKPSERQTWTHLIGEPVDNRMVGRLDGIVDRLDNVPKASGTDRSLREPRGNRSILRAETLTVVACDVPCQTEPQRCQEQTAPVAAKLKSEQVEAFPKIKNTSRAKSKGKPAKREKKYSKRKSKIKDSSVKERKVENPVDKNSLNETNRKMAEAHRRHVWKQLRIEMEPIGDVQKIVKPQPNPVLKKVAKSDKLNCAIKGIANHSIRNKNRNDRKRPGTVEKKDDHKRLKFGKETKRSNQDLDEFIKNVKIPRRLEACSNKQKKAQHCDCLVEKSNLSKARNIKQRVAKSPLTKICDPKNKSCQVEANADPTKKGKLRNRSNQTEKCTCKTNKSPGPFQLRDSSGHAEFHPTWQEQSGPRKTSLQRGLCQRCGKRKQNECNDKSNDGIWCKEENNSQPQTQRKFSMRLCQKCGNDIEVGSEKIYAKSSTENEIRKNSCKQICATCTMPEESRDVSLGRKKSVKILDNLEQTKDKRESIGFKRVGERKSCAKLEMQQSKTSNKETKIEEQNYGSALSKKNIDLIRRYESSDDDECKRNTVSISNTSSNNTNIYKTQHDNEKNENAPAGENTHKVLERGKGLREINRNHKVNSKSTIKELIEKRRDQYKEKQSNIANNSNKRGISRIDVLALVSKYQNKNKNEEIDRERNDVSKNNTQVITKGKCIKKKMVQINFDKKFFGIVDKKKLYMTETKSKNVFKKELQEEGIKKSYSDQVWKVYSALMEGDRKVFTKNILGGRKNVSLETKNVRFPQKVRRSLQEILKASEDVNNTTAINKTKAQEGHLEINATENIETRKGNGQGSKQIENSMTLKETNAHDGLKEETISSKQDKVFSTTRIERLHEIIMSKRRERLNTLEQLGQTIDNISTMMTNLSTKPSSNNTNENKDREVSKLIKSTSNCDKSDDNKVEPKENLFELFINSAPFIEFKRVTQANSPRRSADTFGHFTSMEETTERNAETVYTTETLDDEISDKEETELLVMNIRKNQF